MGSMRNNQYGARGAYLPSLAQQNQGQQMINQSLAGAPISVADIIRSQQAPQAVPAAPMPAPSYRSVGGGSTGTGGSVYSPEEERQIAMRHAIARGTIGQGERALSIADVIREIRRLQAGGPISGAP